MKVLIVVSCILALASAGYENNGYNQNAGPTGGYQGPLHIPVLGPNGVPQEPAEVIAARNNHLANFGIAPAQPAPSAHNYEGQPQYHQPQPQYHQPQPQYHQPQPQYHQPQQYHAQPQYQPQQHYQPQPQYHHAPQQHLAPQNVLGPDGHPQDAPDVAAAKAAHFAAYAEANARTAPAGPQQYIPQQHYNPAPQQHYNPAPQPQQYFNPAPAAHYSPQPAGVAPGPADTPEVAAARAAHFAAHAQAAAHSPQHSDPHPEWS